MASIESRIFAKCEINEKKLLEYGFVREAGGLRYAEEMPEDRLEIRLVFRDGAMSGCVYDLDAEEEYVGFRREDSTGYSAGVRQRFTEALLDVRERCCEELQFSREQTRRLASYIRGKYGAEPEFLWGKYPEFAVFRRADSRKWFALVGVVEMGKLSPDRAEEGEVEIMNLKVAPASLPAEEGWYPAYHMNKKSWSTVVTDGRLPDEEIEKRIDESYMAAGKAAAMKSPLRG